MLGNKNKIIVCNSTTKKRILEHNFKNKVLCDYTFFDLNQFIERYYFKITHETIVEAMNYLNANNNGKYISYSNAKVIVKNIYYVDEHIIYFNKKVNDLRDLKTHLVTPDENGNTFVEIDPYFLEFIRGKDIYVVDLILDNFAEKMFELIGFSCCSTANVYFTSLEEILGIEQETKEKTYEIHEFEKYNTEVEYVFGEISKLIGFKDDGRNDKVDINNVYICVNSDEYNHLLFRYSHLFDIPVNINEKESIKNNFIFKKFIEELVKQNSKEKALETISNYANLYVINQIVKLLNKFYFISDISLLKEVLDSEIESVYYEKNIQKNVVNVVPFGDGFKEDDHVFLIGFDSNNFMRTYKDDEYLTANESYATTTTPYYVKNKLERKKAIFTLSKVKNLHISYSKNTKTENAIALICDEISHKIIKEHSLKTGDSERCDLLKFGADVDKLINFKTKDDELENLYNYFNEKYGRDIYKSYSNNFDKIDTDKLLEKIQNKISLSYSSIKNFYKCSFYYYLDKVLRIEHETDGFASKLGDYFHKLLENYDKTKVANETFDLDVEKEKILSEITDPVFKFYFNKLWEDFLNVISFIDDFKTVTTLTEEMHEKKVELEDVIQVKDSNGNDIDVKLIFKGVIDKLMYKTGKDENGNDVDYVAIVDYKTGPQSSSLDNYKQGFNLQLPVYAYLLSHIKEIKNPKLLGLYLHLILEKPDTDDKAQKLFADIKRDNLKLRGYTTVNKQEIELIEKGFNANFKSDYIKGLTLIKDKNKVLAKDPEKVSRKQLEGFGAYSNLISNKDVDNITTTVKELIDNVYQTILKGDFSINPKEIDEENQSCKYCPYSNICYKKHEDIVELEEEKFVETWEE